MTKLNLMNYAIEPYSLMELEKLNNVKFVKKLFNNNGLRKQLILGRNPMYAL